MFSLLCLTSSVGSHGKRRTSLNKHHGALFPLSAGRAIDNNKDYSTPVGLYKRPRDVSNNFEQFLRLISHEKQKQGKRGKRYHPLIFTDEFRDMSLPPQPLPRVTQTELDQEVDKRGLAESELMCHVICRKCKYRVSVRVAALCKSDCSREIDTNKHMNINGGHYIACLITWKVEKTEKQLLSFSKMVKTHDYLRDLVKLMRYMCSTLFPFLLLKQIVNDAVL